MRMYRCSTGMIEHIIVPTHVSMLYSLRNMFWLTFVEATLSTVQFTVYTAFDVLQNWRSLYEAQIIEHISRCKKAVNKDAYMDVGVGA